MSRKSTWFRSASFAAISTLPVILACALLGATGARADYVVTVGPGSAPDTIEADGSGGAFNTTGLQLLNLFAQSSILNPMRGILLVGAASPPNVSRYNLVANAQPPAQTPATQPPFFGTGGGLTLLSATGPLVGIASSLFPGNTQGLFVSGNPYTSGSVLDPATAIFSGDFNSLVASGALVPGDYTWSWGTGPNQSFSIDVVPLPATLSLLGSGLGALGLFGWRRKRRALAVA